MSAWMRTLPLISTLVACLTWTPLVFASGNEPPAEVPSQHRPPNLIIIFADDMGYGDIASWGHPSINTPNLDRMAAEGQKWTSFYVAASVCTPSRAGLMTGRLPIRSGMCSDTRRVLFPDSAGGLPDDEITVAEILSGRGYATACVGKWHLGHLPEYIPTRQGFDQYFGLPYSNDMDRVASAPPGRKAFLDPQVSFWNVPLMRNTEIIERPADQTTLTRRYTEEAVRFIQANRDRPFFLYLAHTMPHVPLFRSSEFVNRSLRGLYGDVIEEIDRSVGTILTTLREAELAEDTWVVFTSDNGPWLVFEEQGGSAGVLRNGKGSTWEGGMRVPCVMWWPGRIPAGSVVREMGSTLDILPTAAHLAGAEVPRDRVLDGYDISPAMFGTGPSPRTHMFFYRGTQLYAVRQGPYKAHFITEEPYGSNTNRQVHEPPLLFNLEMDPGEQRDVASAHPEVIASIRELVARHQAELQPGKPQLDKTISRQ
ncbi:sulfatase family protein [Thermopirellula anaerolimosa]